MFGTITNAPRFPQTLPFIPVTCLYFRVYTAKSKTTVLSLLFHLREASCLTPRKVYLFVINGRIVVLQVRIKICFYTIEIKALPRKDRRTRMIHATWYAGPKRVGQGAECSPMWEDYINWRMTENYVIINMSRGMTVSEKY